jgi:DNA adenine methylase
MQYFGGKKRIAKDIINYLQQYQDQTKYYFEPFVGSACIVEGINQQKRFASDKNEYLIEMYLALQNGWEPPKVVTEEDYKYIKGNKDENKALSGFVGIGCSFSGRWFEGYARNKRGRNYALDAFNSLQKQKPLIEKVEFKSNDYKVYQPENALVYCDPPYSGAKFYSGMGKFDSGEFWAIMREWSKKNKVFISEYNAPEDFKCVLEINTRTDIRNKNGQMEQRIERLFTYIN